MTDILDPKDETKAAENREVKPLKSPGGVPRPQTVPTMGAPEGQAAPQAEQFPTQPAPTNVTNSLLFSEPEILKPERYIRLSGEDVSKNYIDPLEQTLQKQQDIVGTTEPAAVYERATRSAYPTDYGDGIDVRWGNINETTERAIGAAKVRNQNITSGNYYGLNPNNIGQHGMPNAPALDTDVATRGISSELAKAIEDTLGVSREEAAAMSNDPSILDHLLGRTIPIGKQWAEVSDSIQGLIFSGLQAIPYGKKTRESLKYIKDNIEKLFGKGVTEGVKKYVQSKQQVLVEQTTPQNRLDISKAQFGDYGKGATGAVLYGLNIVPSAIVGSVYDRVDDYRKMITGDDPYEGNRVWDAITKGRDWGLSNQWSTEKYLSLQEPPDKAGAVSTGKKNFWGNMTYERTGNPYWDFPEYVSEMTGINPKITHFLFQGIPAIASEMVVDVPGDALVGTLPGRVTRYLKGADNARTINNAVESAIKNTGEAVAESSVRRVSLPIDSSVSIRPDPKFITNPRSVSIETGTQVHNIRGTIRPGVPDVRPDDFGEVVNRVPVPEQTPLDSIRYLDADKPIPSTVNDLPEGVGSRGGTMAPDPNYQVNPRGATVPSNLDRKTHALYRQTRPNLDLPKVDRLLPNIWTPDLIDVEPFKIARPPKVEVNQDLFKRVLNSGDINMDNLVSTRRSTMEITELAKEIPDPWTGSYVVPANRMPLTDNEAKALENALPFELPKYGKPVTELQPQYLLPSGDIFEPKLIEKSFETYEGGILGVKPNSQLEDFVSMLNDTSSELAIAVAKGQNDRVFKLYDRQRQLAAQVGVKKAQLLDQGMLYQTVRKELPRTIQTSNPVTRQVGDIMLQAEFDIDNISIRRQTKLAELQDLADKVRSLNAQLDVVGDIGRGDIELSLRTREWSGDDVPELDVSSPTPMLEPEPDLSDWGSTTYGLDDLDDFGDDIDIDPYATQDDLPGGMYGERQVEEVPDELDYLYEEDAIDDLAALADEPVEDLAAVADEPIDDLAALADETAPVEEVVDEFNYPSWLPEEKRADFKAEFPGYPGEGNATVDGYLRRKFGIVDEVSEEDLIPEPPKPEKPKAGKLIMQPGLPFSDEPVPDWLPRMLENEGINVKVGWNEEIGNAQIDVVFPQEVINNPFKYEELISNTNRVLDNVAGWVEDLPGGEMPLKMFGGASLEGNSSRLIMTLQKYNDEGYEGASQLLFNWRKKSGSPIIDDTNDYGFGKFADGNADQIHEMIYKVIRRYASDIGMEKYIQEMDEYLNHTSFKSIKAADKKQWRKFLMDLADPSKPLPKGKPIEQIADLKPIDPISNPITITDEADQFKNDIRHFKTVKELEGFLMDKAKAKRILKSLEEAGYVKVYRGKINVVEPTIVPSTPKPDAVIGNDNLRTMTPKETRMSFDEFNVQKAKAAEGRQRATYELNPTDISQINPKAVQLKDEIIRDGVQFLGGKTFTEKIEELIMSTPLKNSPEDMIFWDESSFASHIDYGMDLLPEVVPAVYAKLQRIFDNKLPPIAFTLAPEDSQELAMQMWAGTRRGEEHVMIPVIQLGSDPKNNYINAMGKTYERHLNHNLAVDIAHEIGHTVEYLAEVADASEAFLFARRTGKGFQQLEAIPDFMSTRQMEVDYPRDYIGKVQRANYDPDLYSETRYTEVISVLAESLITNYDILQAGNPDYVNYLMGVIKRVREMPTVDYFEGLNLSTFVKQRDAYDKMREVLNIVPPDIRVVGNVGRSRLEKLDTLPTPSGRQKKIKIPPDKLYKNDVPTWKHGTRISEPLNQIDPVVGGAPSEFGLGVYLSDKYNPAYKASLKLDSSNKPPVLDSVRQQPHIREVNTQNLDVILDLTKSPTRAIKDIFAEAAFEATGSKQFSMTFMDGVKETGKLWDAFRDAYWRQMGDSASEGTVRQFQQYITQSFRNLGIDAGVYDKNGVKTMVVYNNSKIVDTHLQDIPAPTTLESAIEAQRYLDYLTYKQTGTNVAKANYLASNRDLAEALINRTARDLVEMDDELMANVDTFLDAQYKLEQDVIAEKRKVFDDLEQSLDSRTQNVYMQKMEKVPDSPCPQISKAIGKGL